MIIDNGKNITFVRQFKINLSELYKCWSSEEFLKKWWTELEVVELDFREGGNYKLTWKQSPDSVVGEYLQIVPNEKIQFSWNSSGECAGLGPKVHKSTVTILFREINKSISEVKLLHEGLRAGADIDAHHWGWTHAFFEMDKKYSNDSEISDGDLKSEKLFDADVQTVFKAWTTPEVLNRWFNSKDHTLGSATCDLRVGGKMTLDYQGEGGNVIRHYCQFTRISNNELLEFSWISDFCPYETNVKIHFIAEGDKCRIRLFHSGFRTKAAVADHTSGWRDCLNSINDELGS